MSKGKITEKEAQKPLDQRRKTSKRGVSNNSATSNSVTSFTTKNGCILRQGSTDRTQRTPCSLAPSDEEVAAICARVARRVLRLVEARLEDGVDPDDADAALVQVPAPLPVAMPWGDRDKDAFEHPSRHMRRCAQVEGFSLHADVAVAEEDRAGLERLCRYGLRPSFSLQR